jgi:2-dehydro-3-deoxy-D-arabinonate dehydratase
MRIVRFYLPQQGVRLGAWIDDAVHDLTAAGASRFASIETLIGILGTEGGALLAGIDLAALPAYAYSDLARAPAPDAAHLLPPIDRQEVWAAGVTYAWSREARVREAVSKEIYVKVYEAERPELFFKALPEKVVGPNDWVGIRGDSGWNVPEPELALILDPEMRIVGYSIGNDMSSRDIEGENPLYLPQAKVYRRSCALGPAIALATALDASDLAIRLKVERDGILAVEGGTSTAEIHRALDDLASWLGRYEDFPHGAVLLTGTGIVPGDEFTLQEGDEVRIEIEGIGTLSNTVRRMAPH